MNPTRTSDHFETSHLRANLINRTISSGIITAVFQVIQFVTMLGYNMIMSRLLSPREFGLVAMVSTIVGFLRPLREMGLSTATIQREKITHAQVSNLFWLNVLVAAAICATLSIGSPVVAWFFNEPTLVGITIAVSASFLFNGLAVQHTAILNRQMRFLATSVIETGALLVGQIAGIIMAMAGLSYWALVTCLTLEPFLRAALLWCVCSWRPQRPTRGTGTRALVGFGANLTFSGVIYSVVRGVDSLMIGRYCGSEAIGLYSRAAILLGRPIQQLISPIYTVIVPALSRLQQEPERYRQYFLNVFEALAIFGFVFAGLVMPLAHPITVTVFGARWEAAAPIFAAFSPIAIYVPLISATTWLYSTLGRGREMTKVAVCGAVITVAAVMIGFSFGAVGVARSQTIAGLFLQLPIAFWVAGRHGHVSTRDLWITSFRHILVFCLVAGTAWLSTRATTQLSPILQLAIGGPAGLLGGLAAMAIVPSTRRAGTRAVTALVSFISSRKG